MKMYTILAFVPISPDPGLLLIPLEVGRLTSAHAQYKISGSGGS